MELGLAASSAVNIMVLVIAIVFAVTMAVSSVLIVMYLKRYKYKVFIFRTDKEGRIVNYTTPYKDVASIHINRKSNMKLLFLRKNKVGLRPDDIPWIYFGKHPSVFLVQNGLKNFSFCKFKHLHKTSNKLDLEVYDEDISWAINEYAKAKKTFSNNLLLQYLPYIGTAIFVVMSFVMLIYVFNQWLPTFEAASESLKEAAIAIGRAQGGTIVQ